MSNVVKFRGAEIFAEEAKILEQIEQITNKKVIREYFHVSNTTHFGFREFNNRVHQIGIKDCSLQTLPECMKDLTSLTILLLINNNLVEIPWFIGEFTDLEYFYAPSNHIATIPETLCALASLRELKLNKSQIKEITPCICAMESLKYLSLMGNKIEKLPDCIRNLTTLKGIELRDNNITMIPKSLLEISSLEVISLKNNPLFTNKDKETEQIVEILRKRGVQLQSHLSQVLDAIDNLRKIRQG